MKNKINYWAILTFYIIAIICRYLTNKIGLIDGIESIHLRSILTGIGPTLGAIAVFKIFNIKPVMNLKGNYKKFIYPFALYWLLPILLISVVTYYIKGSFPFFIVLTTLVYGLFEEIGWRGFLYQHLKVLPLWQNILIVTILWFAWHLNFETTTSNMLFFGILLLGSWGIGKVSDATNSLLAVSAFHSLNNFFPTLDNTKIIILTSLIVIWVIGLVIRKRMRKEFF